MGEKKIGFLAKKLIAVVFSLVLGAGFAILCYGVWVILLPKELFVTLVVWVMVVAIIFVGSIYRFITPYIQGIGMTEKTKQEVS